MRFLFIPKILTRGDPPIVALLRRILCGSTVHSGWVTINNNIAKYIAIIELHGAENEEDFQQLDVAMKERQFFPQIRDDDGEAYCLPTGSYAVQNTDMVLKAAHDAAAGAAGESGFEFSVIVTGFDGARMDESDSRRDTEMHTLTRPAN